jgi:hypothetical protein
MEWLSFIHHKPAMKRCWYRSRRGAIDDLFVHHFQTDQLLVVRGSFVLVVRRHPFPYDLDAARIAIANLELPLTA